jgi:2-iminobutanoate/2-iminopropanoate deaminase
MALTRVNVPGLARLPAFCHATIAGNLVFVSGTLGAAPGVLELVPGGVAAQTVQTLRNIEAILAGCGCTLADLAKVTIYLTDMTQFGLMNQAYLSVLGDDPPARVTSGCTALALNAAVEMDCVAVIPS